MFNEHGLSVAVIATLTITNVQYDEKLSFGLGETPLGPPSLPTVRVPVQGRKHAVQLDATMASLGFYATLLGSATR